MLIVPVAEWTKEWPTEPGHYLFYGYYKNSREKIKRMVLVEARLAGTAPNKWLCMSGGGAFIFQNEMSGVWQSIKFEPPELE